MKQLMEALDADWVGYEDMQADFKDVPKYGNDNDEVDSMVAEIYKLHADTCLSLPCAYGDSLKPNAIFDIRPPARWSQYGGLPPTGERVERYWLMLHFLPTTVRMSMVHWLYLTVR